MAADLQAIPSPGSLLRAPYARARPE